MHGQIWREAGISHHKSIICCKILTKRVFEPAQGLWNLIVSLTWLDRQAHLDRFLAFKKGQKRTTCQKFSIPNVEFIHIFWRRVLTFFSFFLKTAVRLDYVLFICWKVVYNFFLKSEFWKNKFQESELFSDVW
jgi:hypothetical protein